MNAGNQGLVGGGGVDGAIHRVGGPAIMDDCDLIREARGGCPTGSAVLTTAGNLDARAVIHTVGPRWRGGEGGEAELLNSAYRSSLKLARQHGLRTVAFPSISTGVYGYPVAEAAEVALRAIFTELDETPEDFDQVSMVLFSEEDLEIYRCVFSRLGVR